MTLHSFQFHAHALRKRHPLLRIALGLVGLAVLSLLLVFGLFVGAAMLVGGLLFKKLVLGRRKQPVTAEGGHVVEGEYRVVRKEALAR